MTSDFVTPALLEKLVPILRCPQSHNAMQLMDPEALAQFNQRVLQGEIHTLEGKLWEVPLQKALTDASGQYVYPINDGIFYFLQDYTLCAKTQPAVASQTPAAPRDHDVRGFYDQIGWEEKDGNFEDAHLFEDMRPVVQDYIHKCRLRLNAYLPKEGGTFLLDAASGPVQYAEYETFHQHFTWRICLDFSISALKQAQKKLQGKGVYMLADLTNLPFQEGGLDAICSLHTIYHIPKEMQLAAFTEIYRALMPGKQGVVVYGSGHYSSVYKWAYLPQRIGWKLKQVLGLLPKPRANTDGQSAPQLYVHFYPLPCFHAQKLPFKIEVFQWRTISTGVSQKWIKPWFFGKAILNWVYKQEEKHPQKWAAKGAYPSFVIRKPVA